MLSHNAPPRLVAANEQMKATCLCSTLGSKGGIPEMYDLLLARNGDGAGEKGATGPTSRAPTQVKRDSVTRGPNACINMLGHKRTHSSIAD